MRAKAFECTKDWHKGAENMVANNDGSVVIWFIQAFVKCKIGCNRVIYSYFDSVFAFSI